ncbi:MAG: FlgO family outer membrane protein [Candidatus Desulfacyla sp.]
MNPSRNHFATWACLFLCGACLVLGAMAVPKASGQTYDFDEGMKELTSGMISKKENLLKNKRIAVFGIVEGRSGEQWGISSYIEDEIVDAFVNEGFTVVERRRIEDVLQKEIKKGTDLWFDETQIAQFGKLLGAEVVITGRYNRWGNNILRINVRCISVSDGKVLAANRINVHTDRIEDLLEKPQRDEPKNTGQKAEKSKTPAEPSEKEAPQPAPSYPQGQSPQPGAYPQQQQAPQYGSFCCDQYGVRRCPLAQPLPLGTPCFCPGVWGTGYTCP